MGYIFPVLEVGSLEVERQKWKAVVKGKGTVDGKTGRRKIK